MFSFVQKLRGRESVAQPANIYSIH